MTRRRGTTASERPASRIAIIQGAVPPYRTPLFEELRLALGDRLVIACGKVHFEQSVKSDPSTDVVDIVLDNVFLLRRRLLYQRGYRKATAGANTIVLELNPRVINTWLTLIESKLRGRRTLLWGHHLGRRLAETHPRLLRRIQVRLCGALLAYTDEDAIQMRSQYPSKTVFVAPNATERRRDTAIVGQLQRTDFLYVGRLTEAKRPGLLLSGFASATTAGFITGETRMFFVGEGPLKVGLIREADRLGLSERVAFVDGTFDSKELNDLYASAVAGVCGGYVGLNITQSLSRGVPFIYPATANHSPEVALARPGFNAFSFDPPDAASAIAIALADAWSASRRGIIDHEAIRDATVSRYCIEAMVAGFLQAVLGPTDSQLRPTRPSTKST